MNSALIIPLIYSFVLPIGLLVWWKIKTKEKLWPFIAGAICFTVFAMVLESIMHNLVLVGDHAVSKAINSSAVLYTLYASFAAGIFEETGRLFGFRVLLKNHREKECSVAYGIGHGGIEVILLLGTTYLLHVLATAGVPLGDAATEEGLRATAGMITLPLALAGMFERIPAVMIHISLSILVFMAAKIKGKMWLYPVAIVIHALADSVAALYQFGAVKSLFFVEAEILVFSVVLLIIAVRAYKKMNTGDSPAEEEPVTADA